SRIQKKSGALHPLQAFPVDEPFGLRKKRAMEGDDVGLFQNFIDLRPPEVASMRLIGLRPFVPENLHVKSGGNIAHFFSDRSESDNSDGLPREFDQRVVPKTEICRFRPLSTPYGITVIARTVTELQEQGEGQLGHR